MMVALAEMHGCFRATGTKWARKLDGSYVPQPVFRCWTADHPPCPFVEGDSFTLTNQGRAVIQRHILHQHGVVVAGTSPQTMLDPVAAYGIVASKPVAARWCQQALDQQWTALIAWALTWPHDTDANHLAATLHLIQYTLDRSSLQR